MYEFFRNDLLNELGTCLTPEQLQSVSEALDKLSSVYSFSKMSTDIAVVGRRELQETIAMYLVIRKGEGLAKSSQKTMAYVLRLWSNECTVPLKQLTANYVRAWLYNYQDRHGTSPRSMDLYRSILCTFLKWCAVQGYIEKDITATIKKIKYVKKHRKALTQIQLQSIRHACHSVRQACIVEVLYSTGCRVAELVGIKMSDVDWAKKQILVTGKGNKQRIVYLNAKAEYALKAYLDDRKDNCEYLIEKDRGHGQTNVQSIQQLFYRLQQRCNMPKHTLSPHIMRHTMATQAATVCPIQQVQQMLGHTNIATTMIYAETNDAQVKAGHTLAVI